MWHVLFSGPYPIFGQFIEEFGHIWYTDGLSGTQNSDLPQKIFTACPVGPRSWVLTKTHIGLNIVVEYQLGGRLADIQTWFDFGAGGGFALS